jgi:hypothetical protein
MSKFNQSMWFVFDRIFHLEKLHWTDVCFQIIIYVAICLGNLCIIEKNKYVFKNRCLAELNMKRRRIKWLIAICWNNHNDDDVKGHAWQKYPIVDHIVIMWLNSKWNFFFFSVKEFDKISIGMCNNHLFVWDGI